MANNVQYENGNIFSPVLVIADDPTDENNVLVCRLGTSVSVPKSSVTDKEGTPETAEGNAGSNA